MPCLNEAESIASCIGEARRALAGARLRGEIVIADNGSEDGSAELAARAGARVVKIERRGYGAALRGGVKASRGRFVLVADADGSYPFSAIPAFVRPLADGCDLVHGSRLRGRIARNAMPFAHRRLGTPFFNFLLRVLFGMRITDSQSGMRAFSRAAFRRLRLASDGMEINSEILAKAALAGLKLKEIPVDYGKARRSCPSHLHPVADGWRNLLTLLRLRFF